ncbi:Malonyl CoA-acyl carrier protein transacylase [Salinihabitans flavidus]|uniref:[acyl-carrier-protein] S-malonyltransferase n=1 Tax=Salinihabitans flavidus TaxID=569882 RepID=A0A1H8PUF9_9RHOB|nr:ACP S-malonyltransferase [Salinihabitans flavidus]SEO45416.1 Malonyl CoA-acyl carrier protein transacylase [Salinihabitans flavidus]
MTRRAVVICPGRGTYNRAELGYLARHHAGAPFLPVFDDRRAAEGQETLTALDGAARFSAKTYARGDVASPLIYASSLLDARTLAGDVEVVAVTGNSMGWYTALAVAGAVTPEGGFEVVNTMGRLMHEHMIGGQLVYPVVDADWRDDPARRAALLAQVAEIDARAGCRLGLSIALGGMLVLAGNEAGLSAFEAAVPTVEGRFPMRLPGHAAFHTDMQASVAEAGRAALPRDLFGAPERPVIDGRGRIWWPHGTDRAALHDYTLGAQVITPYDFTRAITVAAREFAPDLFIVTGPGTTLGGAVAQSLILAGWQGMTCKADFEEAQNARGLLAAMGRDDQRRDVICRKGDRT